MSTQQILDTKLFGYRWKGVHNPSTTYEEGDVVYRLGGAYVWRNGAWAVFGPGQQDVTTTGHLMTGEQSVGGAAGQSLYVAPSGAALEFRHSDDRNGTTVKALMQCTEDSGPKHCGASDMMMAIMTDGSVRGWGRTLSGQMGTGNQDVARQFPVRIPFPPGTPPIKKIVSVRYTTYFLDESGTIWVTGANSGNVMSGCGITGVIPIPTKLNGVGVGNEILSTTKITDIITGKDYGDYFCVFAKDDQNRVYAWGYNRYGQLGVLDGVNTNIAKLVPFTANTPINKIYAGGGDITSSCFIDFQGNAYFAGAGIPSFLGTGSGVQVNVHQRLETQGRAVKKYTISSTDDHATAGTQATWAVALLLENGQLYVQLDGTVNSSGIGQATWTSGGYLGITGTPYHTNVDDIYFVHGGYPRLYALMKDGTVQMRGRSSYYGNGVSTDAEVAAWTTIGGSVLTNVVKLKAVAGQYAQTIAAIKGDGTVAIWGRTDGGLRGTGENVSTVAGIKNVQHDRPIVDVQFSGYCWYDSFVENVFLLDDLGRVLALGDYNYGVTGYPTSTPLAVPGFIRF